MVTVAREIQIFKEEGKMALQGYTPATRITDPGILNSHLAGARTIVGHDFSSHFPPAIAANQGQGITTDMARPTNG